MKKVLTAWLILLSISSFAIDFYSNSIPKINVSKEIWVKSMTQLYNLDRSVDISKTRIELSLRPGQWDYYKLLKEKIAKLHPFEVNRATINLFISNSNNIDKEQAIGITGGTGPLFDAQLLGELVEYSDYFLWNRIAINLYSAAPPRTFRQRLIRGTL
jgi:hypothetical protein